MSVGATLFARVLQAFEERHGNRLVTVEFTNRLVIRLGSLEQEYLAFPRPGARLTPPDASGASEVVGSASAAVAAPSPAEASDAS